VNVVKDYVQYKLSSAMYWTPKSLSLEFGTPFTTAHLNAIAAAPGTITYSVNLGSRPAKGLITVVASFDPDDPALEANEYEVVFKVADRQTLNIPALPTRTLSKKAASNKFTVKATSSSKLTVKATSLTTSVCTVSKLTIQVKKKGKCQIRFSQAGNANYLAAASVTKYFMVK
jgi:hypothetical protein